MLPFIRTCVAIHSILSFVQSFNCNTRVRQSYDSLTSADKALYRRALALSMDKGYYIKFVEMHTEMRSEQQAHRVCTFIYWHRYFLLGFENMLRSLGDEYKCITVPYWDEVQDSARQLAGTCSSIESCSSIVRDLGGSSVGPRKGIIINGEFVNGNVCVNTSPLDHFCESSSKTGAQCAKCVPRGNLKNLVFPGASSYVSIYRQILLPSNYLDAVKSIEDGMHNALHATLGGAMETFEAPSDALFFSHHAYVDLIFTISFKCRTQSKDLKATMQEAFSSCPYREDAGLGNFSSSTSVAMRVGENGTKPMNAFNPNQALYPFFKDLPKFYTKLSDTSKLGAASYSYDIQGLVKQINDKCAQAPSSARHRRLESIVAMKKERKRCTIKVRGESPSKNVPSTVDQAINPIKNVPAMHEVTKPSPSIPGTREELDSTPTNVPAMNDQLPTSPTYTPVTPGQVPNPPVNTDTLEDGVHSPRTSELQPVPDDPIPDSNGIYPPPSAQVTKRTVAIMNSWVDEISQNLESNARAYVAEKTLQDDTAQELEKMMCMFYDQCRGGVRDYSETFKKAFKVTEPPPCKRIVDAVKAGTTPMKIENWLEAMEKYFPCTIPTKRGSIKSYDYHRSKSSSGSGASPSFMRSDRSAGSDQVYFYG